MQDLTKLDQILQNFGNLLANRPSESAQHSGANSRAANETAAALMRVNHTGEVAAQALYHGQAVFSREQQTRRDLLAAADEEQAHLDWCEQRVSELGGEVSKLGPFWYWGSYSIGLIAGMAGDRWSMGFVKETEQQVVEHLEGHLERLPVDDQRSREIVSNMIKDEARHAQDAERAGANELPDTVKALMRLSAKFMTTLSYRI